MITSESFCKVHYPKKPELRSLNCFTSSLMCYLENNSMLSESDLIHFDHKFKISNFNEVKINNGISGLHVESAWSCNTTEEVLQGEPIINLKKNYGITVDFECFYNAEDLLIKLKSLNFHCLCMLDIFYLPTSPFYKKEHIISIGIITGFDFDENKIFFLERQNGLSEIHISEFIESCNYLIDKRGCVEIYSANRCKPESNDVYDYFLKKKNDIVNDFFSKDESTGYAALQKFRKKYKEYVDLELPFVIHWLEHYPPELHSNHKYIEKLIQLGMVERDKLSALSEKYKYLSEMWYAFDSIQMHSFKSGIIRNLSKNIDLLDEIVRHEYLCVNLLKSIS